MALFYSPIVKVNQDHIKKVAKWLRKHKHLILDRFKADGRFSSGTVEWLNPTFAIRAKKRSFLGIQRLGILDFTGVDFQKAL